MRKTLATFTLCAALFASAPVFAEIPDCYAKIGLSAEIQTPAPQKEVFIFIDQTTLLNASLQNDVRQRVSALIQPGNAFVLGVFSAFSQGRYLEVLAEGALQTGIEKAQRSSIGVKKLKNFDLCLDRQKKYGRKIAAEALAQAFQNTQKDLKNSDVLSSLSALSERVKLSSAPQKVLFLISDMLENSSISSFYAHKNVRNINAQAELKKVDANQLFADFAGARVYVLGAGLITAEKGKPEVYRDPKTMKNLETFWRAYFEQSNAQLKGFGAPSLLVPVE